ncbi:hypothetical protein HZ326_28980 [Fusarium oxysporum f. sp. albedinis]|nr:hypothetical protein HZ326_28980 [Fusarium oxysporum f. sp. albedinis]
MGGPAGQKVAICFLIALNVLVPWGPSHIDCDRLGNLLKFQEGVLRASWCIAEKASDNGCVVDADVYLCSCVYLAGPLEGVPCPFSFAVKDLCYP